MSSRLLVIDDELMVRESIVAYLEDSGYQVDAVDNGDDGLALLSSANIDLVLCDLIMPHVGGLAILQEIKQRRPDIPVIVVSGAGVMDDVVQALRLGASDYLVKPIWDMAVLEHSIRRNLERVILQRENDQYRQHLEVANNELQRHLDELRSDQHAGRQIQMQMLPSYLDDENISFCHLVKPSLMLSGDFLDYFPLDDEHYGFYVADVSGHGASSAFITVLLKNLTYRLRRNLKRGSSNDLFHPVKVLQRINQELLDTQCSKHLTMVYAVINIQTHEMQYSVGGHLPAPILYQRNHAEYLEGRGMPIGLFRDAHYELESQTLIPPFSISLFSDGILEVLTQDSLVQKEKYLLNLIEDTEGNHQQIVDALSLGSDGEIPDDITLMSVFRA